MTDKELINFARDFTHGVLGKKSRHSTCFVVCAPLNGLLNAMGVKCELKEFDVEDKTDWYGHFCILLEDGRVLDPTMRQFKHPNDEKIPNIYLGKIPDWYKLRTPRNNHSKLESF